MKQAPVEHLRYYIDRMSVHARLTAGHLNMSPEEALPALVVTALVLAEHNNCTDRVVRRIRDFLGESGVVSKEELEKWL